jgi:SAM-dependent methyltransferase
MNRSVEAIGSLTDIDFNLSRYLLGRVADYLGWIALIVLLGVVVLLICRSKRLKEYWHILMSGVFTFEPVNLDVKDFESSGLILDIGGGGEGVIGRQKGKQVVAIDIRMDELLEAVDGPRKVVTDARKLSFLDGSFSAATAFFSMMYIKTCEDHQKVMSEAWRALKPGGHLHLWDVDLSKLPETKKGYYLVRLHYRVGDFEKGTGYGMKWPDDPRSVEYYIQLAEEAGFQHQTTERNKHVFYLVFIKQ